MSSVSSLSLASLRALNLLLVHCAHLSGYATIYSNFQHVINLYSIHCAPSSGYASIYSNIGNLPTAFSHLQGASVTDNSAAKTVRLVVKNTGYIGPVFISVHSIKTGSKFQLWAFPSGDDSHPNKSMNEATRILRGLNILASHDRDVLHMKLPQLRQEAKNVADNEAAVARKSILTEMLEATAMKESAQGLGENVNPTITEDGQQKLDDGDDDDDDYDVMERFVMKVGRMASKKQFHEQGFESADQNFKISPYMHKDVSGENCACII